LFQITTIGQALAWGIEIYGVAPPRVLSKRMLDIACVNVERRRCPSAIGQGFPGTRCLSYLYKRHLRREWDTNVAFDDPDKADVFWRRAVELLKPRKLPLQTMPRLGVAGEPAVSVQAAALGESCEVRATWVGDKILNLEIDTFNSVLRQGRPLLEPVKLFDPPVMLQNKQIVVYELRPWKMLPASMKLADLGTMPWRHLEEGGEFFDKPAGFMGP
jgi:hypothetical protein